MIDKQKLSNFLELRASHHRQMKENKGFEEYADGAKKEAIITL